MIRETTLPPVDGIDDEFDPEEQERYLLAGSLTSAILTDMSRDFSEWIDRLTTSETSPTLVLAPNMFPCTFCGAALDFTTIKRIFLSQHLGERTVPFIMTWTLACGHNLCARCLVQQVLRAWRTKVYHPMPPLARPQVYRWVSADKTLVPCIYPGCTSIYTCVQKGTTWSLEADDEETPAVIPFHHLRGYRDECSRLEDLIEHGNIEVLIDENMREWGPLFLREFRCRCAMLNS